MRAVIIGTDFVKDTDGSFKAIETNTNIGLDVSANEYIDVTSFTDFVLDNSFTEIHLIASSANLNITDVLESPNDSPRVSFGEFLSMSICVPNEISYTLHKLDEGSVTIPYLEDSDSKLIIRLSYDTTALIDDVYARDNWEFLKLMHDVDETSIPKCYINDSEFGIDNIGETLRDNGNHPNYCIKKRITPTDNKVYPKLFKVNSIEELDTLKTSLEIDEYIQEYVYNTEELIQNKTFHYRSVDLVYNQLDSLNLYSYQKTNILPIVDSCDFDDNNKVQIWDRPRYVSKFLNGTNEISIKLDADETTRIVMSDDSVKTANSLNINDSVKSIQFTNEIPFVDSTGWSGSYSDITQNFIVTSSVVVEKDTFEYFGKIISIEFDNGSKFSDVPHGRIFKVVEVENETSIETNIVQVNYENLKIGDTLLLINNEENTIESKIIQNIEYSIESLNAYRINIEQSDLFLSLEETENQSKYAILTHNYDYDCQNHDCSTCITRGYDCNSGNDTFYGCSGCIRVGGIYGSAGSCYTYEIYGYWYYGSSTGYAYCNGNKPSDMNLKKNIKYSHTLPRGLRIYTFEFNDDFVSAQQENFNDDYSGKWQGILAQDLLGTEYEDCLNLREDGFFEVNYTKLNLELTKI
jgi:hypothetical protein